MSIELPTLLESQQAFHTKMNAAFFFYKQIKKVYIPESKSPKDLNEVFYYVDAVLYEFHSASQMLLQIINVRAKLNEPANKVSWNPKFQKALKKSNSEIFDWWDSFNSSQYFHLLEAVRQQISHRGDNILFAVEKDGKIDQLSIAIRFRYYSKQRVNMYTGKSIELLDELNAIGEHLNNCYEELQSM